MSGLKIYLRSKVTRAYHLGQLLVVFCLLLNGVMQLRYIHAPLGKTVSSFVAAAVVLTGFLIWRKIRRKVRYLPGVAAAIAGAFLAWSTWDEVNTSDLPYPLYFYITGWLFVLFGLAQFVIDGQRWMSLSSRSVRLKRTMFAETRHPWDTVNDISVEEKEVIVLLKSGQEIRVVPERCDMQHLRSRVNLIFRNAHATPGSAASKDDLMGDMFGA